MKKRDLNLEKYHISKNRYRELYYFCMQYTERAAEIEELRYPSGHPPDGMPKGTVTSDRTASVAVKAAQLDSDNDLIRQAAEEAGGTLAPWILKAVTNGMNYNAMRMQEHIPCNEKEFRRIRHKFFYILDQKKR